MSFNWKILRLIQLTKCVESKLELARYYGFVNAYHHQGEYNNVNLEKELIEEVYQTKIFRDITRVEQKGLHNLHLISVAYSFGGHTRLCERLASMDEIKPELLLTGFAETTEIAKKRILKLFSNINIINSASNLESIYLMVNQILRFRNIVLHIHPEDINAIIAIGIAKKIADINVYLVNHSDHTFIFGDSIVDYKLQLSGRGALIHRLNNGSGIETFLGIPLDISLENKKSRNKVNHLVMAGSSWKMKPQSGFSAPKIINFMIREDSKLKVSIIGVNLVTDYWWIFCKLKNWKKIKLYSKLNYDLYKSIISNADGCIDTIPIAGGTAFVEMYLNGLRAYGIHSGVSGYTPLEACKVDSYSDMLQATLPVDINERLEFVHGFDMVKNRYLDAFKGLICKQPQYLSLYPNNLDIFVSTDSFPLSGSFYRLSRTLPLKTFFKMSLLCFPYFTVGSVFNMIFLSSIIFFKKILFKLGFNER